MWLLYSFIILFSALVIVLVVRTLRFVPKPEVPVSWADFKVDEARIIESLQAMIRFKTISYKDKSLENPAMFEDFKAYLKLRYPLITQQAEFTEVGETGILFKLKGKKAEKPIVLMSHYDVVPPNGEWQDDPFSGKQINGKIYGRGTLDTKSTLCAVMESVEHLLAKKHRFNHDLYLAFSGDEETRGPSADAIVQFLKEKGVRPYLVLDEGGAVVEGVFPGVKNPAAMIGLAEKGYINLHLEASDQGGHASMPKKATPITQLANAIQRLNKGTLFKLKKTPATMAMFDTIARHSSAFINRMIFANLWLFWPLIKLQAKKADGELLSLLHTTQAFTQMTGSDALNVLPSKASIAINYRILTGETIDEVVDLVKRRINDDTLKLTVLQGADPTPISVRGEAYDVLSTTVRKLWNDAIPTPYLMMAGTDSRYYHAICDHVYRFSPMTMTKAERATIHSTEEAIRVEALIKCVKFYITLLEDLV